MKLTTNTYMRVADYIRAVLGEISFNIDYIIDESPDFRDYLAAGDLYGDLPDLPNCLNADFINYFACTDLSSHDYLKDNGARDQAFIFYAVARLIQASIDLDTSALISFLIPRVIERLKANKEYLASLPDVDY